MSRVYRELKRLASRKDGPQKVRRLYASFRKRKAVEYPDSSETSSILSRISRIEKFLAQKFRGAEISAYPTYEFVLSLPNVSPEAREGIIKGIQDSLRLDTWNWTSTSKGWELQFSVK